MVGHKRKRSSGLDGLRSLNSKAKQVKTPMGYNPESLLDLCARQVAATWPFEKIEQQYERIPEPVQERIVFWSFPRNERQICMYSSMARIPASEDEYRQSSFYRGIKLLEHGCVRDVLQVGFHLSGEVVPNPNSSPIPAGFTSLLETDRMYKVSLSFDRCKITSVTCSCDSKDVFWCQHAVALALYRIRNAGRIQLRVPISETLLQMDRSQLQKFVQYLISAHHTEVLPTAQHLADDIIKNTNDINAIDGAPDPTAGAPADLENSWHLDEAVIKDQVKNYLSQGGYFNANKNLASMFSKVREMLRVRDNNGSRMLTMITEQFLADPRLILWKSQGTPMTDKCRVLWDQLSSLWVSVVLNPKCDSEDRQRWRQTLESWSQLEICPLEDPDHRQCQRHYHHHHQQQQLQQQPGEQQQQLPEHHASDESERPKIVGPDLTFQNQDGSDNSSLQQQSRNKNHQLRLRRRSRTIFHKALDALHLDWSDPTLNKIIKKSDGNSVIPSLGWHEHVPTAAARVEALKTHGYDAEALRLAASIAKSMKQRQALAFESWKKVSSSATIEASGVSRTSGSSLHVSYDGWIGHSLNPIGCLFDILSEACVVTEDKSKLTHHMLEQSLTASEETSTSTSIASPSSTSSPTREGSSSSTRSNGSSSKGHHHGHHNKIRYQHVPMRASSHESYLSLAFETALIALGQQRIMPPGLYSQEKAVKQEERLLAKIMDIDLDSTLVSVLRHQIGLSLEMGPTSGLGLGIHPESIPMQTFAKHMFVALLPYDAELAFKIGLRAMRLPILEELEAHQEALRQHHQQQQHHGHHHHHQHQHQHHHNHHSSFVLSRVPRWFTLGHIESQQCALASTMLSAAKGDLLKLRSVLESAQRHIHSSAHLFKLAQDSFRYAMPRDHEQHDQQRQHHHHHHDHRNPALLNVAFQLGLQVMRMTLTSLNWRRREMVRWLVTCATEVGLEAIVSLMQTWKHLFTPTEATGLVASTIMSHATVMRLNLNFAQQEEMATCARTLALQCAHEDPSNCALNALTLCENEPLAFETAYQIVTDAAAHIMTSSQLFTVARYMEHRGYPTRAHRLALLAMKSVQLAFNQDAHPAINDVHWAAALAHSLGKDELAELVPLVVKNVACATVLADVLRRCSMTSPGLHHDQRKKAAGALAFDQAPLRQLLEATIAAFVTTVHSRLTSISPRHYNEFIDFLLKARETFMLASDGLVQFAQLVENMKLAYKGKKKLICLIKERFG